MKETITFVNWSITFSVSPGGHPPNRDSSPAKQVASFSHREYMQIKTPKHSNIFFSRASDRMQSTKVSANDWILHPTDHFCRTNKNSWPTLYIRRTGAPRHGHYQSLRMK